MREEKVMPVMLGVILALLILEFGYAIYHNDTYQDRVNEGNARWKQVEERIKEVEERCGCGRTS